MAIRRNLGGYGVAANESEGHDWNLTQAKFQVRLQNRQASDGKWEVLWDQPAAIAAILAGEDRSRLQSTAVLGSRLPRSSHKELETIAFENSTGRTLIGGFHLIEQQASYRGREQAGFVSIWGRRIAVRAWRSMVSRRQQNEPGAIKASAVLTKALAI